MTTAKAANAIRWNLFKAICRIGWRICPEPQRSDMQRRIVFEKFAAHTVKNDGGPVRIAE